MHETQYWSHEDGKRGNDNDGQQPLMWQATRGRWAAILRGLTACCRPCVAGGQRFFGDLQLVLQRDVLHLGLQDHEVGARTGFAIWMPFVTVCFSFFFFPKSFCYL